MKRLVLIILVLCVSFSLYAQLQVPEHHFATGSGNWGFIGSRLYQNDPGARLAKVNFLVPQSGPMIYEFNVRYEDGIEDGHGGFGLHIFADNVINRASWGSGNSWLLWLNYDENPISPDIPAGFSAQIYRSTSQINMELVESFDLNEYIDFLTWEIWSNPVPVRIWVNGNTGEVRVYDPTDPAFTWFFYFFLPTRGVPLNGNWVSLRTNGLRLSFEMGL